MFLALRIACLKGKFVVFLLCLLDGALKWNLRDLDSIFESVLCLKGHFLGLPCQDWLIVPHSKAKHHRLLATDCSEAWGTQLPMTPWWVFSHLHSAWPRQQPQGLLLLEPPGPEGPASPCTVPLGPLGAFWPTAASPEAGQQAAALPAPSSLQSLVPCPLQVGLALNEGHDSGSAVGL